MRSVPPPADAASTAKPGERRRFAVLFVVMLAIAVGNTALQSVLPAIGRTLGLADTATAVTFSFSALIWSMAAPWWARRSDRFGSKGMLVIGLTGLTVSLAGCALAITAGLQGWLSGAGALAALIIARMIYGMFGSAAPPAAQAMVARSTTRAERTTALTLLASAFGLGTILGPALAPFCVLPVVGLAGPGYVCAVGGVVVILCVLKLLPSARPDDRPMRGAATAEPTIGGEPSDASAIAASHAPGGGTLAITDRRIWRWLVVGLVSGHAQVMVGQAMAFLVMDRLQLPPAAAQPVIGIVLMSGAGAALLAQWGLIPRLGLSPRLMLVWGCAIASIGCLAIALSASLHALAVAFALASLGFGFTRPGFTAGASLAVDAHEQALVAGRVTSVNGVVFVLGPPLSIGLYGINPQFPYGLAAAGLLIAALYAWRTPAR